MVTGESLLVHSVGHELFHGGHETSWPERNGSHVRSKCIHRPVLAHPADVGSHNNRYERRNAEIPGCVRTGYELTPDFERPYLIVFFQPENSRLLVSKSVCLWAIEIRFGID